MSLKPITLDAEEVETGCRSIDTEVEIVKEDEPTIAPEEPVGKQAALAVRNATGLIPVQREMLKKIRDLADLKDTELVKVADGFTMFTQSQLAEVMTQLTKGMDQQDVEVVQKTGAVMAYLSKAMASCNNVLKQTVLPTVGGNSTGGKKGNRSWKPYAKVKFTEEYTVGADEAPDPDVVAVPAD